MNPIAFLNKSLGRKIGAILVVLSALIIFQIIGVLLMLQQQKADTAMVNIAGRQRMLSQKMSKYALLAERGDPDALKGLATASELFDKSHQMLTVGDEVTGIQPASEAMQPLLADLEKSWTPFYQAIQEFSQAEPGSEANTRSLDYIIANNEEILSKADKATGAFQTEAEGKTARLMVYLYSAAAAALITSAAALIALRRIINPLHQMTSSARQIAEADLASLEAGVEALTRKDLTAQVVIQSQQIEYTSEDEIGVLAQSFNLMIVRLQETGAAFDEMREGLRGVVNTIAENSYNLNKASSLLAGAAQQTEQATSQIAMTINQVAMGIGQQAESFNRTAISAEQMARAIDGVARGAQEQSTSVAQASQVMSRLSDAMESIRKGAAEQSNQMSQAETALHQVDSTLENVYSVAEQVAAQASQAATSAVEGVDLAKQITHGVERVHSATEELAQNVRDLGQRSGRIGAIVQTIEDIASQTNLLALNAAIEAARAGAHGKGFAVVADEVRKLAERSANATKEIAEMIGSIQAGANHTVEAMQRAGEDVSSAVQLTNQASIAFQSIASGAQGSSQRVQGITRLLQDIQEAGKLLQKAVLQAAAISQQNRAAAEGITQLNDQMVEALDNVSAVVEENTAATEEMAASSSEVSLAIENIASVSQENSAAVEEVSASGEEMSAQAGEVNASAQALAELATQLTAVVAQFKLGMGEISGMQVELFKQAHLKFAERLRGLLAGKATMRRAEVASHQSCALGNWYYGYGQELYAHLHEFKKIEAPHVQFHKKSLEIVEALESGNRARAENAMQEVERASLQVTDALERLEARVSESAAEAAEAEEVEALPAHSNGRSRAGKDHKKYAVTAVH
ncbi:MAG: methyl-accepting chemotaxis protein [Chloroflexi bacterium]|nr:methyl-accepting chemotaxis protein [Chloroflexota bacterium]